jgi:hypothetical protein
MATAELVKVRPSVETRPSASRRSPRYMARQSSAGAQAVAPVMSTRSCITSAMSWLRVGSKT